MSFFPEMFERYHFLQNINFSDFPTTPILSFISMDLDSYKLSKFDILPHRKINIRR